jgi:holo-[acyl-carrier protein] synthase
MSGQRVIAIGTDIIECPRIADMLAKHGDVFVNRVFTATEIEYCAGRKMDYQHYAGRWAAKEAVLKALGTGWSGGIKWTDVELIREPSGQPKIVLYNRALERSQELGIDEIMISVSHTREFAVAFATALGGR